MISHSKKVSLEIHDKMNIARNIVLNIEKSIPYGIETNVNLMAQFYTEVDANIIEDVLKNKKSRKSFLEWYTIKSDIATPTIMCFERMRRIIIEQYLNNLAIPTRSTLRNAISILGYTPYTSTQLKTDLFKLGYIWKRLQKSNKYIIVEDAEQVSSRMKFFNKMKEFRDQNRCIVYIEIVNFSPTTTEMIVVVSPQRGLLDSYFDIGIQSIEFWLLNKLNTAPENAVFVIEQACLDEKECLCELPTIHSQKKDMKKWLDLYGVPYDTNAHKSDLFALIEKYKVTCPPLYRSCEILKARGHDCLLRPPELTETKYSEFLEKDIQFTAHVLGVAVSKPYVADYINSVNPDWLGQDRVLAEKETCMYEEDKKLELILDKLIESAKNEDLTESDFDECEDDVFDSEYYDNFLYDSVTLRSNIPKRKRRL